MGYTSYSVTERSLRADTSGYYTASVNDIFQQQSVRRIHESMSPDGVNIRECRDSEAHPNTFPIILGLDVTGSMQRIPHELIKDGLPTLMGTLVQNDIQDASLCFVAVGDHTCDNFPLQVAQFESGDSELDMWLTRTYLEGGGGGNEGESYHLVWDFAANKTATDAWEKRKQKGVVFTIGDEPVLSKLPKYAVENLYGTSHMEADIDTKQLLKKVQEQWNVYHLHICHNYRAERDLEGWKKLLGENCIPIKDYHDIPKTIAELVMKHTGNFQNVSSFNGESVEETDTTGKPAIML